MATQHTHRSLSVGLIPRKEISELKDGCILYFDGYFNPFYTCVFANMASEQLEPSENLNLCLFHYEIGWASFHMFKIHCIL